MGDLSIMPFIINDRPIEPFSGFNEAIKADIGALVRADTNKHTGGIYLTLIDEDERTITLVIHKNEITKFLTHVAQVAYVASKPIGEVDIKSIANEPNTSQ